jgi:RND family efflux transporter MFP subunit
MSTLWVNADVPETQVREVSKGAKALVRIGGIDTAPIEGSVAFIAPMVDAATRTAQVRVEVRSNDLPLKPGMFAQVEIETSSPTQMPGGKVLAVPDEAIQIVEGRSVVFIPVDGQKNTFVKRLVRVGHVVGGMAPVLSGLKEGELIVVAGTFILKADFGKGSAGEE